MLFVAEIGLNHDGNFNLAYELIRQAREAGADVAKFQFGWRNKPDEINFIDRARAVRFIRQHAGEYGVDPNRIGVFGSSAGGQLALLLGTTADSGDPSASDAVLRESSRVGAVVAYFPPTDLSRWGTQRIRQAFAAMRLTDAEAAEYSPIRFVSPGAAPSLIVHGDADTTVPMVEGETMHAALTKAGVPASFIRI